MEATIENSNDKGVVSHDGGGHDKGICEYRRGHTKVWKRLGGSPECEGCAWRVVGGMLMLMKGGRQWGITYRGSREQFNYISFQCLEGSILGNNNYC
ncbi:hypothetical protein V6N13_072060 [Hibiscus sabdariffa]